MEFKHKIKHESHRGKPINENEIWLKYYFHLFHYSVGLIIETRILFFLIQEIKNIFIVIYTFVFQKNSFNTCHIILHLNVSFLVPLHFATKLRQSISSNKPLISI